MADTTVNVAELLGDEAESLLGHSCKTVSQDLLTMPGPDFVERAMSEGDRGCQVLRSMQGIMDHGRLGGTGYLSILPVDQGIEHSAGASFAPNPAYFDPAEIVELAIEGGCNAVASTYGVLGTVARKYAHRIPFLVKFNHNEFLSHPNQFDQRCFGSIRRAWDMGAAAVGATIYFGSKESHRQIEQVGAMFEEAHSLGMVTFLWCYLRNPAFKTTDADGKTTDYHASADLTAQANHLGATLKADIVKQKQATNNGGYAALNQGESAYGKFKTEVYTELSGSDEQGRGGHPIDLCRYQVLNGLAGRTPLINSGGESKGKGDLAAAVRTAVINKRAGGAGLISGRKAFQRPRNEGVALLNAIQDVYLDQSVTLA